MRYYLIVKIMESNIMARRAGPKPFSNCSDHFPVDDHGVRASQSTDHMMQKSTENSFKWRM